MTLLRSIFCMLFALMVAYAPPARSESTAQNFVLQLKWFHQFQFAGFYAALEQGYYADEALTVEIRQGGPKVKVNREVVEGRAHFGVLASELIEKRIQGEPLVLLAVIMQHSQRALIFRSDSGIQSPSDLLTRTIMLNANEEAEFMAMFRREGVDVQALSIIPKNKTANAKLMADEIDAINGSIANQPYLFAQNGIEVRTLRPIDYGVDFYGDSLFTSEEIVNAYPEQVAAFRRATLKGWAYAFQNVDETIALIREKYNAKKSAEQLRFEADVLRGLVLPELVDLGHVNPGRIQRIADTYRELGIVSGTIDLERFLYQTGQEIRGIPFRQLLWIIGGLVLLSVVFAFFWRYWSLRKINIELNRAHEKLKEYQQGLERLVAERTKELSESIKEADKANQSKSRFLSSMSHELRTPLNAVIGFSQLMQHNPKEPLTAVQKEYTDDIVSSGEMLLGLINGMLDLAKIEADQLHLTMEDVYASDVIDESLMLLKPTAATHGVTVINNTTDHPSVLVYADALRLTQVLLNFMSNGVKYNKPGGSVTLDSRETDDGYLHISVTDTGIGIPKELQSDIFKPFERLGIEAKRTIEGTGIGLTVTKQLVKMMGGRIGFESEHHQGSTFWVEVPMASRRGELPWDDKLVVGIQQIDDDHKVLVGLLNELSESSRETDEVEKVIGKLIAYTLYHFQREEAVMEACGYPHLDVHRKVHQHLAAKAAEFAEKWRKDGGAEVVQELLEFLRTWLVDHIMNDDAEIEPFAKGKEAEIERALRELEI